VEAEKKLRNDDWLDLLASGLYRRGKAFARYASYYLSTNGQTYWSDTNQLSAYLPDYARKLRAQIGGEESSLVITEIYVPRPRWRSSHASGRIAAFQWYTCDLRDGAVNRKGQREFSPLAKESYACAIFNLLTLHTSAGIEASAKSSGD